VSPWRVAGQLYFICLVSRLIVTHAVDWFVSYLNLAHNLRCNEVDPLFLSVPEELRQPMLSGIWIVFVMAARTVRDY
jgi:hypothetical protein